MTKTVAYVARRRVEIEIAPVLGVGFAASGEITHGLQLEIGRVFLALAPTASEATERLLLDIERELR